MPRVTFIELGASRKPKKVNLAKKRSSLTTGLVSIDQRVACRPVTARRSLDSEQMSARLENINLVPFEQTCQAWQCSFQRHVRLELGEVSSLAVQSFFLST